MDILAVRTFVAIADTGRFSDAADDLDVTQQAVSKRIAGNSASAFSLEPRLVPG